MSNPPPYDLIGAELRELAQKEGADLWRNRTRLTGLLLDSQPDLRREIRAVVSAVEQGVAHALIDCERSLAAITIDRQASHLESEAGLRTEVAQNVTRAIAHALDLGPLPSIYGGAPAPGPAPYYPPASPPAPMAAPPQPQPMWSAPTPQPTHFSDPSYAPPQPYSDPSYASQTRKPFPWPVAIIGGALATASVIVAVPLLSRGGGSVTPTPTPAPTPTPTPGPTPPVSGQGYANELLDYGVPMQATLRPDVGSATPLQIPGAQRITTDELRGLIERYPSVVLVDVLAGTHPRTIANAKYVPSAGLPGSFDDAVQTSLPALLSSISDEDVTRPLVFFCAGANCWESYNAALRARRIGYQNLYWYRGGLAAWQEANLPMEALPEAATE